MKIGIVGWGVEGQSAYRYFGPEHDYLIVNEEPRDDFPPGSDRVNVRFIDVARQPGTSGNVADLSYLDGIDRCDKIIYSVPSVKNLEKRFGRDKAFWAKTTTAIQLFFENVKTKNIIGVTGTKGKGTTATLIYELLKAGGKPVLLGGNIGKSPLDFINDVGADSWVVLELSSFQLYSLTYSPHISVCLMVAPEHMDWHGDLDEYIDSKSNLFRHQKPDDIAIYNPANSYSQRVASVSPGRKIPYTKPPGAYVREDGQIVIKNNDVIHTSEIKLLGRHNLENICAACTAVFEAVGGLDNAKTVLSSFSGLEHRLEHVREFEGVNYYDDSFGTTPETAIVAIKAFEAPKVVILGGSDKGAEFDELAEAVSQTNVKHAIVIGQITGKIVDSLKKANFNEITTGLDNMPAIVGKARGLAAPGDVVLLSTGAASFDMFKNYKDRGNQFKQAVQALA